MASRFGYVGWRQNRGGEEPPSGLPQQPSWRRDRDPRRAEREQRDRDREARQQQPEAAEAPAEVVEVGSIVPKLVLGLVALYAFVFAALSVQQHHSFNTHAFDLGNMDQAVWNTANGRPFEFTNWEGGTSRLAAHVEPILLLVAQVYRFWPDATTLLVLQSVVISLGALPAFWLARRVLKSDYAAAVFAGTYLLSPALEIANLADFHAVAFSSALLLFAFWFVYRRQYPLFWLFAVLAMATKEHVPFSVFVMGLYIAFVQKNRTVGYITCGVAVVWAVVCFAIVIPAFNPAGQSPYLSRYDQLGKSPGQMVWNSLTNPFGTLGMLTEPARLDYLFSIISPTLFLSLLSPATALMMVPDLAINLLSNFVESYAGRAHYGAVIVPFVTVSAILGAGNLRRIIAVISPPAATGATLLLSTAVLLNTVVAYRNQVFLPLTDHLPEVTRHDEIAADVLKLIPADAAVSASTTLNPHLSQRRQLSLFPDIDKAEYVVVDVTASPYPIDAASQWYRLTQMVVAGGWGVVGGRDGVLVLRRGEANQAIPGEFYSFIAGNGCKGGKEANVPFGQEVRLTRYYLEPGATVHGNDPSALLHLCFQAERRPADDFIASVTVVDQAGTAKFSDRFQASILWRPSKDWEPGEVVEAVVPWLPLGQATHAELRVGLRDRAEPYDPLASLAPRDAGKNTLGIRDGGTTVALAIVTHER